MLCDSGNVSGVYLLDIVIYIIKMMRTYNYICVYVCFNYLFSVNQTYWQIVNIEIKKGFQTVVYSINSIIHNSILPNVNL